MRLGSWIRWIIFLAVLSWAGYTVAGAGWSYFAAQEVVDTALRNASARHRAAFATGSQVAVDALAASVRADILLAGLHEGLRMEEGDVTVSANSAGFSATIHWSYPVISYKNRDILVVPMSVQRSTVSTP